MVQTEYIKFFPYKLFEKNDCTYLYASRTGGLYLIDNNIKKLIEFDGQKYTIAEKYFEDKGLKNEFNEAVSIFQKKYIIETIANVNKLLNLADGNRNISSITLMIVQDCNLRCKYCYGGDGQYSEKGFMSLDVAKKSVDFLMNNSLKENVSIIFFGGEPLVNFSLIKDIVGYSKELCKKYKKNVYFSMTTNATLVNEEIAQFLKENNFTLTISIDGDEETHNINRYYANKKGSYKDVVRGIKILTQSKVSLVARGTISPENINITRSVDHLMNLDFKTVFLSEALNLFDKKEDFENLNNQYYEMVDQYRVYLKNDDYDKVCKNKSVKKLLDRLSSSGIRSKFCGAMINTITVDKDGFIYPCHRFVANKEYKIGNVYTGIIEERYEKFIKKDLRVTSKEKCFSCWAYNICGGGCPNENLMATGKCNNPYEEKCRVFKKYLESIINLYLELTDIQKERLFKKSIK